MSPLRVVLAGPRSPFLDGLSGRLADAGAAVSIVDTDSGPGHDPVRGSRGSLLVLDAHTHPIDFGRPSEPGLPEWAIAHIGVARRTILLSSHLARQECTGFPLAALEAAVGGAGGAILRLGRVLDPLDPLLVRWRNALKEGVPVAPLPCPLAPVDMGTALAAVAVLTRDPDLRGEFACTAPDETTYAEIADRMRRALQLPENRVTPTGYEPSDFGLLKWPERAADGVSAVLAEGGVRAGKVAAVLDNVMRRVLA
jgi:hypothetical protein